MTQHTKTPDQAGVLEPSQEVKETIKSLLTFTELPTLVEMNKRAIALLKLIPKGYNGILIGGASFFMPVLHRQLVLHGYYPHYAFSKRESKDIPQKDGSVKKVSTFKLLGYVTYN